jgi:hypothetical protein
MKLSQVIQRPYLALNFINKSKDTIMQETNAKLREV